jgi:hypothetical protein
MSAQRPRCPDCRTPIRETEINQARLYRCSGCDRYIQAELFPAFFRESGPVQGPEDVLIEGESTCFYHPAKKAILPCSGCGRFLCSLCDCDLSGQHFCPTCLETGRTKKKIKNIERERTRYDNIALSLVFFPMILFYVTFITAPIAIIVAVRHWNSPPSMIHRTKTRYVVAIILAALQVVGWIFLVIALIGLFYAR